MSYPHCLQVMRSIPFGKGMRHDDVRRIANSFGWAPHIFEMKLFTDNFFVAYPLADPAGDRGEPECEYVIIQDRER